MRNRLLGIVAFAALSVSGSAYAADAADADDAPPAAFATPSWSGFYVGVGAGYRWSQTSVTTKKFLIHGTPSPIFGNPRLSFNDTAPRVSPYAGFNWEIAPQWIVGPEADYGFADKTSTVVGQGFTPRGPGSPTNAGDSLAVRTAWDTSLRARAGFLFTPSALAYVTAGAAWQHYDVTSTCSTAFSLALGTGDCSKNDIFNAIGDDLVPSVIKSSVTKTGWTVGGGLETLLWGNWLARVEYRYANFGSSPFSTVRTATNPGNGTEGTIASVAVQTHTVTIGIAYLFN